MAGADIITATTNSISALFPGALLQPGVHVSCVKPCELDAATYKRADPLIIHWHEAKPFQIAIGVDRQSIPDVAEGWQHPITREDSPIWDFPTLSQLVNGEHPGRTKNDAISCFCNNVGLGLQFAAVGSEVLARAREARDWAGNTHGMVPRICASIRPMKKAHLLRCARPTRSNVPQRVRLRSSVFARLASKTFLIGLVRLLIGDIKYLGLILLFSLVVWAGVASAQTTKLKVAYPTTVGSMAVIWVAKDARLFEKHGLEVELIYVAGSSKVVQAMLAKEIPISEIAIPAVIQANLAGVDLVMLAGPNHKPGQKIMVKPEIKTPENLKGKKIGISRFGTSDDFLLRYILGQWKIQPDRDVALLQMGGSPEILAGLGFSRD
jgi:hypothetical protein